MGIRALDNRIFVFKKNLKTKECNYDYLSKRPQT